MGGSANIVDLGILGIRCFYGFGILGVGLILFIGNFMISNTEENITSSYLGIYASCLFCISCILGLVQLK